jgi:protein TonB
MRTLLTPEYETLDYGETQAGGVKHNGSVPLDVRTPPFDQQAGSTETREPAATMANNLLNQDREAEAAVSLKDGVELDLSFGVPVKQTPLLVDLYENIRDLFFPPKLPPLELTSTPIPVPDRMAVKRNPWAVGISATVNAAIVTAMLVVGFVKVVNQVKKDKLMVTPVEVSEFKAPKSDVAAGGGGGSPDKVEAIEGRVPPRMQAPVIETKVDQPPLPSINIQPDIVIPDNPTLPNFGMSNSPNVKLASLGNGSGTGLGSGQGSGYGSGSGGNIGGGLERIGGAVTGPVVLFQPDAEFSDEARRAKYQGVCIVEIVVDAQGNPQNPRVVRTLGMGLDEKAIEAVMKYKFRPARKNGKPVAVWPVNIEVNFKLY